MEQFRAVATVLSLFLLLAFKAAPAQSLDKLNLQFQGYATQAFIYTNQNNWNTTNSTDGSLAWTEGVANVTAQPHPRLRFGAQMRYFRLGQGNNVIFDWVSGEFKVNEYFGVRVGKVKSPGGLLNEIQDIDPAYPWVLLPQSIYPLASRDSNLAVRGGVVFGSIPLGERLGKLQYRGFGGERVVPEDTGSSAAGGSLQLGLGNGDLTVPGAKRGPAFGATLQWAASLPGLLAGLTYGRDDVTGSFSGTPPPGRLEATPSKLIAFTRYERHSFMIAGEYGRLPGHIAIQFGGGPGVQVQQDQRSFYVMASSKPTRRLTAGAYYSNTIDLKKPLGPSRYQKDWTLSARYDLDRFLYLKVEQHFLDGTFSGFEQADPDTLRETSRLSFVKLGVTF